MYEDDFEDMAIAALESIDTPSDDEINSAMVDAYFAERESASLSSNDTLTPEAIYAIDLLRNSR